MRQHGEITVFLALMLSVLSAFILLLVQNVRTFIAKSEMIYAVDNAVRSCFAEYNRELFDRFHILLIDSTYKGYEGGTDNITEHFSMYLESCLTKSTVVNTDISGKCAGAGSMYDEAVRYAAEKTGIDPRLSGSGDDALFLSYILNVCGNDAIPCRDSYRRGETEYLLYGYVSDDENIRWAHLDMTEEGEDSYEEYLAGRLEEEDITVIRNRFSELVTEYMKENGSPGFDPDECFGELSFSADVASNGRDYRFTREYAYVSGP